jgi:hypothetical protein
MPLLRSLRQVAASWRSAAKWLNPVTPARLANLFEFPTLAPKQQAPEKCF